MLIVRTQTAARLSPAGRRKACIQCEDHAIGRSLRDCSTASGGSRESAIFGLYQRPGVAPVLAVEEERLQHCASARRDLHYVTRTPPQIAVAGGDKSRIAHRRTRAVRRSCGSCCRPRVENCCATSFVRAAMFNSAVLSCKSYSAKTTRVEPKVFVS